MKNHKSIVLSSGTGGSDNVKLSAGQSAEREETTLNALQSADQNICFEERGAGEGLPELLFAHLNRWAKEGAERGIPYAASSAEYVKYAFEGLFASPSETSFSLANNPTSDPDELNTLLAAACSSYGFIIKSGLEYMLDCISNPTAAERPLDAVRLRLLAFAADYAKGLAEKVSNSREFSRH